MELNNNGSQLVLTNSQVLMITMNAVESGMFLMEIERLKRDG